MKKIIRLLLVLNIAFSGCATVPRSVGNGVFSKEKPSLSTERLHNPDAEKYVDSLLKRVAAYADEDYHLSVDVLSTARVQGVFSFMFDEVEVTRGMLNVITNESELACLIAHEVGHCALKHDERFKRDNTLDKVLSFALGLFIKNRSLKDRLLCHQKEISDSGWGKKLEMEADRYGAELAAKQPLALERYLTIMETVADVAKRYDIGRDDIFPDAGMAPGPQFMEEEICQDIPLWAEQAGWCRRDTRCGRCG